MSPNENVKNQVFAPIGFVGYYNGEALDKIPWKTKGIGDVLRDSRSHMEDTVFSHSALTYAPLPMTMFHSLSHCDAFVLFSSRFRLHLQICNKYGLFGVTAFVEPINVLLQISFKNMNTLRKKARN